MYATSEMVVQEKKRIWWSDEDTHILLKLWAERATDLKRTKRNGHVYREISLAMNKKFSTEEVHVKIRNFTQKYREEKKQIDSSGGISSNWKYFSDVHDIIGNNTANSAEVSEKCSFVREISNVYSIFGSNVANSTDDFETFSFEKKPDVIGQLSSESEPLPSPVSQPLLSPRRVKRETTSPSSPQPSSDMAPSSAAADSSSGRKRNHLGEAVKIMKEQNAMLRTVVEDNQSLTREIVNAIREQNETGKEFISLMKTLIEKF